MRWLRFRRNPKPAERPLPPVDEPVDGYSRAGYVILKDGEFCFDAGTVWAAHDFMVSLRSGRPA